MKDHKEIKKGWNYAKKTRKKLKKGMKGKMKMKMKMM